MGKRAAGGLNEEAAANVLRELGHAEVGADGETDGLYAAYFYDMGGGELRAYGGYASVGEAAEAIPLIRARAALAAAVGHPDPYDAAMAPLSA